MTTKSYEDGLRDGKIEAIESTQAVHAARLDAHSDRLDKMERIIWVAIGGLIVLQALPLVQSVLSILG